MATIKARKQANGSTRYTAIVRIRRGTTIVHRESRTFTHHSAAQSWARHREVALENPAELTRQPQCTATLGQLIRWYIDTFESISGWQRTKQTSLEFLERHPLSQTLAHTLTTADLIRHVQSRRKEGAGPATAINDLIWIGVVLRAGKSVRELPVNPEIVVLARTACRELRLIAKARKRDRRPTPQEIAKLREYFRRRDQRAKLPMEALMDFAITSTRREAEICRLEWRDNDKLKRTGMVRDAKHPRSKEGNHRRFKYTPEGWAIVCSQQETSEYRFPYNSKSISTAFTRACHLLGIHDLRFHDLRHEATSRLFEAGYQIHEVAQFSLHESWNDLKRYANLRPENLKDIRVPAFNRPGRSRKSRADAILPSDGGNQSVQQDQWH
jgi:integrase